MQHLTINDHRIISKFDLVVDRETNLVAGHRIAGVVQ